MKTLQKLDFKKVVLAALKADRTPYAKLAKKVGVSERWIYKLMAGNVASPGLSEMQRLYDYLQQKSEAGNGI